MIIEGAFTYDTDIGLTVEDSEEKIQWLEGQFLGKLKNLKNPVIFNNLMDFWREKVMYTIDVNATEEEQEAGYEMMDEINMQGIGYLMCEKELTPEWENLLDDLLQKVDRGEIRIQDITGMFGRPGFDIDEDQALSFLYSHSISEGKREREKKGHISKGLVQPIQMKNKEYEDEIQRVYLSDYLPDCLEDLKKTEKMQDILTYLGMKPMKNKDLTNGEMKGLQFITESGELPTKWIEIIDLLISKLQNNIDDVGQNFHTFPTVREAFDYSYEYITKSQDPMCKKLQKQIKAGLSSTLQDGLNSQGSKHKVYLI